MSGDLIGSRISLISRKDIRWEGILVQVDRENASVTLQSGEDVKDERRIPIVPRSRISFHVSFNRKVVDPPGSPSFWRQPNLLLEAARCVVLGYSTRSVTCVRVVFAVNEKMQRPVGGPLCHFYARHVADTQAKREI